MSANRPVSTLDLSETEQRFLQLIREIQFGYVQDLRIEDGQLVLDPQPLAIKDVKFGAGQPTTYPEECELKRQIADFFQFVRTVGSGEIRRLEIRHAAPILAEIEHQPLPEGGGSAE